MYELSVEEIGEFAAYLQDDKSFDVFSGGMGDSFFVYSPKFFEHMLAQGVVKFDAEQGLFKRTYVGTDYEKVLIFPVSFPIIQRKIMFEGYQK